MATDNLDVHVATLGEHGSVTVEHPETCTEDYEDCATTHLMYDVGGDALYYELFGEANEVGDQARYVMTRSQDVLDAVDEDEDVDYEGFTITEVS
jgi:hypothetical protein